MSQPRSQTDLFDNPLGTDGFEFVEFTSPEPRALADAFEAMGFTAVARHRSKHVLHYRQGDVDFILNMEPRGQAAQFRGRHGPSINAMAFRVRDAVPGTEVVHAPTDPDLRDYNVSFEKIRRTLDFRTEHSIDDGIREVLGALRDGVVDPDERRWYTLKQYVFLRDAERAYRDLAVDGKLLSVAS